MKNFLLALGLCSTMVVASEPSQSQLQVQAYQKAEKALKVFLKQRRLLNVITWDVGDFQNMEIRFLLPLVSMGSSHKEVSREEVFQDQQAIWLRQETSMMGTNSVVEQLISRADGSVLRQIQDGQEQAPSTDPGTVEVLEQYETTVKVPAGQFDCLYTHAQITQDGNTQEMEIWQNPINVNMGGTLKVVAQSPLGPMTMLLREFGPQR